MIIDCKPDTAKRAMSDLPYYAISSVKTIAKLDRMDLLVDSPRPTKKEYT